MIDGFDSGLLGLTVGDIRDGTEFPIKRMGPQVQKMIKLGVRRALNSTASAMPLQITGYTRISEEKFRLWVSDNGQVGTGTISRAEVEALEQSILGTESEL